MMGPGCRSTRDYLKQSQTQCIGDPTRFSERPAGKASLRSLLPLDAGSTGQTRLGERV